jgi:hypothetical protein
MNLSGNSILAQYAIHRLYNNSAPQYLYTSAQQELTQISTRNAPGIWGVFTTIHRSANQKLKTWPEDIHGCIGHYQINPFKPMTTQEVLKQIDGLIVSTATTDDRRNYLPRPFQQDADARIEVSIMCGPLLPINPQNGQIQKSGKNFNNQEYGLVVLDQRTGMSATYLPGVFPSTTTWPELTKQLSGKAGIPSETKATLGTQKRKLAKTNNKSANKTQKQQTITTKWFAYKTTISSCTQSEYLLSRKYAISELMRINTGLTDLIVSTSSQNPGREIPYEVRTQDLSGKKKVIFDDRQNVRNLSMVLDIQRLYARLSTSSKTQTQIGIPENPLEEINLDQYLKIFDTTSDQELAKNQELAQAAAHALGLAIHLGKKDLAVRLYNFLFQRAKEHKLEPVFEWGQVLIAIAGYIHRQQLGKYFGKTEKQKQNKLYLDAYELLSGELSDMPSGPVLGSTPEIDDIFKLNWHTQFIVSLLPLIDYMFGTEELSRWQDELLMGYSDKLPKLLGLANVLITSRILPDLPKTETNYLAVAFECLSIASAGMPLIQPDYKPDQQTKNNLIALIFELHKRYDERTGTYKFITPTETDQTIARLDISGHVINSLLFGE